MGKYVTYYCDLCKKELERGQLNKIEVITIEDIAIRSVRTVTHEVEVCYECAVKSTNVVENKDDYNLEIV